MSAVFERLRALLGAEGVERDPHGLPCAVPESDDALALVVQAASEAGWRLRVEGQGSWLPADAPADLALSTRGLNRIVQVSAADLVATVEGGVPFDVLRAELETQRLWLALDPPGRPDRSLGSIVATGTAGPLRHGFGPVRDHVLGCTVVTGDGKLVEAGGKVVKNVAGYDLTKLHVGGFGAFGVITELHLRLRAQPALDATLLARGTPADLFLAALELLEAQVGLAALEVLSPASAAGPEWTLALRVTGTAEGVEADSARAGAVTALRWERLQPPQAAGFWGLVARAPLDAPVALRLGALQDSVEELTTIVSTTLGEGLLAAGPGSGAIRWAGDPAPAALRELRRVAAEREVPVTVERAPLAFRQAVGHFGAYREGVGQLVHRLRATFDPRPVFQVALEGEDG
jgi:glycolate oxidase FAD binding subunit